MNAFRRSHSALSWARRLFTRSDRPRPVCWPRLRPFLEALEDRTLPTAQFVDLGALRFGADAFTRNGNDYSASGTIELGLAPTAGEAFKPLLDIVGSVAFTVGSNPATLTLANATLVGNPQSGQTISLWQESGSVVVNVSDLLGGGIGLPGSQSVAIFQGTDFRPDSLSLANPGGGSTADAEVRLQGELTEIDPLIGAKMTVDGADYVSLVGAAVHMTNLEKSVGGSFEVEGLGIASAGLTLNYNDDFQTYTLTGNVMLSTEDLAFQSVPAVTASGGLVVEGGHVSSAAFDLETDFHLFDLKVHLDAAIHLEYQANPSSFVMYGSLTMPLPGCTTSWGEQKPLQVNLGTAEAPGVSIMGGKLQDFELTLSGRLGIYELVFEVEDAGLSYRAAGPTIGIFGKLSVTTLFTASVTIGDADNPGIVIQNGDFELDDLKLQFVDVNLGAFTVENLVVEYKKEQNGDLDFGVSLKLLFPGGFRIQGECDFIHGELNGIGLGYEAGSGQGIEIYDTGIFITGLSGQVENIQQPANLSVSGSLTAVWGPTLTILHRSGQLIRADGTFHVDKDKLVLGGKVYFGAYIDDQTDEVHGILGEFDGTMTLDWDTQDFGIEIDGEYYDGLFRVHATADIGTYGHVVFLAEASVNVPSVVPFIGGDKLASVDFAFDFDLDRPMSQNFVAAWVEIDALFFSFDIGFKVGFDDISNVQVIGGSEIDQIKKDESQQGAQHEYRGTISIPEGATQANFAVTWPDAGGTQSVKIITPDQTTITQLQFGRQGSGIPAQAANIKLLPQLSTGQLLAVHQVGDNGNEYAPLAAGDYTYILTSDRKYDASQVKFSATYGYAKPYFDPISLPTNSTSNVVTVPLSGRVNPALASQLKVRVYADSAGSGYNGTLISDEPTVQVAHDGTLTASVNWDLTGLLPLPYYVYAVIDDGVNTPVYSSYSTNPVEPYPALSGLVTDGKTHDAILGIPVYLDTNLNGQYDQGEPSTVSGDAGYYAFYTPDVPQDMPFRVGVKVLYGFQLDASNGPNPQLPALTYQGQQLNAQFLLDEYASIDGTVFSDLNQNGRLDPGEVGLAGWTVYLDLNKNGTLDPGDPVAQSRTDGSYTFFKVPVNAPDAYTVALVMQSHYVQTGPTPLPPGTYLATITDDFDQVEGKDFGVLPLSIVAGKVTGYDLHNGRLDPTTTPVAGATIQLSQGGSVIATTQSASDGSYAFPDLLPGTYSVQQVVPSGWRQIAPFLADLQFAAGSLVPNGKPAVPAGSITAADFNGDGKMDFATPWTVGQYGGVNVFFGKGDGTFSTARSYQVSFGDIRQVIALDSTGAHRFDLAVISQGGRIDLLLNDGRGNFQLPQQWSYWLADADDALNGSMVKADFDGDGREDLAAAVTLDADFAPHLGVVVVLSRDPGHPVFTSYTEYRLENAQDQGGGLGAGDINGDGRPDLVIGGTIHQGDFGGQPGPDLLMYNQGSGSLFANDSAVRVSGTASFAGTPVLGDINGDGRPDAVVSDGKGVQVLYNTGSGLVYGDSLTPPVAGARQVVLADLAGHLKNDLLVFPGGGDWSVYTNLAAAPYYRSATTFHDAGGNPAAIALADVNGDGLLDMLVADAKQNGTLVYLNRSTNRQPTYPITVGGGEDAFGNDFVDAKVGQINGWVFDDANRDGRAQPAEPGRTSVTVYVDKNRNGRLDPGEPTCVTGPDGAYAFDGLRAGSYQVRVLAEDLHRLSTPGAQFYRVTISGGLAPAASLDFGSVVAYDVTLAIPPSAGAWTLYRNGDRLEVFDEGQGVLASYPLTEVSSVTITGSAGRPDRLTLDLARGGYFAPPGGVTFVGGAGAGDALRLVLGDAQDRVSVKGSSLSVLGGPTVRWAGVETLTIDAGSGANILLGRTRLNGTAFLNAATVFDDRATDTLFGALGHLFLAKGQR